MAVELLADEKVLYTREYCKGFRRSKGTVTITDKRLISTIESKSSQSRTELKIEEVHGVTLRFKPASVLIFVIGVILGVSDLLLSRVVNQFLYEGAGMDAQATWGSFFEYFFLFYGVLAVVYIIIGLFKIRSGFYLGIKTPNYCNGFLNLNAGGKFRPLYLKPKKKEAFELMCEMSSAIIEAKHGRI